jgi:hypothetical protein
MDALNEQEVLLAEIKSAVAEFREIDEKDYLGPDDVHRLYELMPQLRDLEIRAAIAGFTLHA